MSASRRVSVVGAVCLFALPCFAQVSGRITGSVMDAQGAAVPGANVRLFIAGGSSEILTTTTSLSGNYVFSNLPARTYDLTVELSGFRKQVIRSLKVDPGLERTADVTLEVSSQAEIVEITAEAISVQTSNAEVAATITNEQIRRLPTLNRSPLALIGTQAGVGSNSRGNTTINGMRPSFTNITIDGINVQDNYIRTNALDFLPNMLQLDQIAEMTISTSNTNAGMGSGAAQVSFVTPSGSNELHGGLIWTNRNNFFSANTWFNNRNGVARPFLNQNQLGGKLSGRIIKDKLFYYGNYEATRLHQQSTATRTILRPDARQGIFTYRDTSGALRTANVLTAAGGVAADARMRDIISRIPGPEFINRNDIGDTLNTGGYSFLIRDNRIRDNITSKIDYIATTKHSFTGTWLWNRDNDDRPDLSNDYRPVPIVQVRNKISMLSTTWRWNPTATFTNEARGGYNLAPGIFYTDEQFGNGIFAVPLVGNPVNTFRAQGRYTDTYNIQNNSNWFVDKHSFSFGFQGQLIKADPFNDAGNLPTWTLGISAANTAALDSARLPGVRAQDVGIANSLLALHGGFISSASQTFNVTSRTSGFVDGATNARRFRQNNYSLYFNDNWKVNRRLTLTMGVRWEYYTPMDEVDALYLLPVLRDGNAITALLSNSTLDFAGSAVGRPLYQRDWNNFGPNFGLAWQPFGDNKTVLRAGYSINFPNDDFIRSVDNNAATNSGLAQGVTLTNRVDRASSPTQISVPAFRVPRTFADNYAVDPQAAFGIPDPELATPYVQQWNIGVQREIRSGVLEVRYVANRAVKQFRAFDYNQVQIGGGFLEDFQRARNNGELALRATNVFNPAYNPAIAGSQPLPFFDRLPAGGTLANATIRNLIQTGQAGELANTYMINRINGPVSFYRNPVALGTNMMSNYSVASYDSLQIDYRRTIRSAQIQANYVWSKSLSDTEGVQQTRFEPFLDINNGAIERAPTAFDLRHSFKANGAWELPLGRGRKINVENGVLNQIVGGWTVTSLLTLQSGSPFSIFSGRGTLNRGARSGVNTANTTLNWDQLKEVMRFRMTGDGPFMVAASAIGADTRGAAADGQAAFSGQVFFNPGPGELGALQRRMFTGPRFFNIDFAVLKQVNIREDHRVELRGEFFNLLNTPSFYIGDQTINNTNFGRITSTASGRRVVQFGLQYRF